MFYRAPTEQQSARMRRARPVVALAGVSFAIGAIVGAGHASSASRDLAARFVSAWSRGDYAEMYSEVDARTRHSLSERHFAAAYESALVTATAVRRRVAGRARGAGDAVDVPVRVATRLFGTLALPFAVPITGRDGPGEGPPAVAWSRALTFPGLHYGEALKRESALPPRARLLARDGSVLAEGSLSSPGQRSSPLGTAAAAVVGELGAPPASRRKGLLAQGVPADAVVGVSGLERVFEERLRGVPGGRLLAADARSGTTERVLASTPSRPGAAVRTTISPALQRAAATALGGQLGGIVALRPSSGEVTAVAGIGLDSVQPPGSTFKMITVTGVLEAGIATPRTSYPYATYATLDGVKLNNADGESCGGTLERAFADTCNSVFAPLGVELGTARLVSTAEKLGFNSDPGLQGAAESTLPAPDRIQGELDLGSTAIGQGQVQASTLQMAIVAATIGNGGSRPRPTFSPTAARANGANVIDPKVARTVRRLMTSVVRDGTGTAAAIPGIVVAGKTGTAELKTQCGGGEAASGEASSEEGAPQGCEGTATDPSNTDAWFAAFAPALRPRIVVAVLLVKDGAGGATAAPVAREVLETALRGS
jgi:hypothetical protein